MILRQTALLQEKTIWHCVIKEALKDNKKVLAVTGGFHSLGLYELLKSDNIQKEKLHKLSQKDEGCFPVAYSYEAADALSGYASGIQRPIFMIA